MPQLNVLELTSRLRAYPPWVDILVHMLTSRSADKHEAQAIEAGVSHYLTKPYQGQDLLGCLRTLLRTQAKASAQAQTLLTDAPA